MVVQRFVVLVMVVFVGYGEDELDEVKPKAIIWRKDGAELVLILAGCFEMGEHFKGKGR